MQITFVSIWLCILARIWKYALLYVESYANVVKTIWKRVYKLSLGRRFYIQSEPGGLGQTLVAFFLFDKVSLPTYSEYPWDKSYGL